MAILSKGAVNVFLAVVLFFGIVGPVHAAGWDMEENSEGYTQKNGDTWYDVNGDVLDSHATSYIQVGDTYYMFGERRIGQIKGTPGMNIFDAFVSYSSKDLVNWTYEGVMLSAADIKDDGGNPLTIVGTRTKVIYNSNTGQYVMYFKAKKPDNTDRKYGLAVADTVTGPYTFVERAYPTSGDFGDGSLFIDTDGTGYLVYSSLISDVRRIRIDQLTEDYLGVERNVYDFYSTGIWTLKREAPQLFRNGDTYYVTTSGTKGWSDTQGEYTYSSSLSEGWAAPQLFGNATTYDSQGSDVLMVQGSEQTSFIFAADHWDGDNLYNSLIKMFPISFDEHSKPISISNTTRFRIDVETGEWEVFQPTVLHIDNKRYPDKRLNAQSDNKNVNLADASTATDSAKWMPKLSAEGSAYYFLDNPARDKRLRYAPGAGDIQLGDFVQGGNAKWKFDDAGDGYYYIVNADSGNKIAANGMGSDVMMAASAATDDSVKWKITVDGRPDEPGEPDGEEIYEIKPLADIRVAVGASLGDVHLPTEVAVEYCDETEGLEAVVWDVSALDLNQAGSYTLQGEVEGTDLRASVTVIVEAASAPETPHIALTGTGVGTAEGSYAVNVGIQMPIGDNDGLYAQDITIVYDTSDFTFDRIDNVKDGLHVQATEDVAGTIRLLVISLGSEHAIVADTALLDVILTAKPGPAARSEIAVTGAIVADGAGIELEAETSVHEVLFLVADLNGDGKISIGDLAIVGRYYGMSVSAHPEAAIADIDGDGTVGLTDLVFVAGKILNPESE